MDKKVALVTLIENSFVLPNEVKLELLGRVEGLSDTDVEKLGTFLAAERQFVLDHEKGVRDSVAEILQMLDTPKPEPGDAVYVGTGRP